MDQYTLSTTVSVPPDLPVAFLLRPGAAVRACRKYTQDVLGDVQACY